MCHLLTTYIDTNMTSRETRSYDRRRDHCLQSEIIVCKNPMFIRCHTSNFRRSPWIFIVHKMMSSRFFIDRKKINFPSLSSSSTPRNARSMSAKFPCSFVRIHPIFDDLPGFASPAECQFSLLSSVARK